MEFDTLEDHVHVRETAASVPSCPVPDYTVYSGLIEVQLDYLMIRCLFTDIVFSSGERG